jgi:hypothetical protein
MQVGHGDHDQKILIHSVDEPVWETGHETASQPRFYLAAR